MVSSSGKREELMKKRVVHLVLLTALLALSTVLMGGGNDCPKACVSPEVACATVCGGELTGTCSTELVCESGGGN